MMTTNLFSSFDPASFYFFSMNWSAALIAILLIMTKFWFSSTRLSTSYMAPMNFVYKELSMVANKSPFSLLIILAVFSFILWNNLMGIFPYIFTSSSHMVFTVPLALTLWLSPVIFGWLTNTSNLLIHMIPHSTPLALMPFMVLIELVSLLIRPLTLSIRLAANLIAGHLLIILLSSSFLILPMASLPVLGLAQIALNTLELAVAFIQAYVFSVLSTLYAMEAIS